MDEYIYGVARIRALESTLLTDEDIDALVSAKDESSALQMLKDKGWGSNDPNETLSDIIKIWQRKFITKQRREKKCCLERSSYMMR